MERVPWILMELKDSQRARLILGVMKPPHVKVNWENYQGLYREKIVELVKRTPEFVDALETYLREPAYYWISKETDPQEVVTHMEQVSEWSHLSLLLILYLQKRGSLEDVKERLYLDLEDPLPVNEKEFEEELANLDLWQFLDLAT